MVRDKTPERIIFKLVQERVRAQICRSVRRMRLCAKLHRARPARQLFVNVVLNLSAVFPSCHLLWNDVTLRQYMPPSRRAIKNTCAPRALINFCLTAISLHVADKKTLALSRDVIYVICVSQVDLPKFFWNQRFCEILSSSTIYILCKLDFTYYASWTSHTIYIVWKSSNFSSVISFGYSEYKTFAAC